VLHDSKQQGLNRNGHWHPHLMFLVPSTEAASWGAGSPGSPGINWSDGTPVSKERAVVLVALHKR